jgi:hypothetical protein
MTSPKIANLIFAYFMQVMGWHLGLSCAIFEGVTNLCSTTLLNVHWKMSIFWNVFLLKIHGETTWVPKFDAILFWIFSKWAFPTTLLSVLYWIYGCGMIEILVGLTCSKILYNKSKKPSSTCLSKDRHPTILRK